MGNYKIDMLEVEITRKCQLKCQHCFRGDAQFVNMDIDVINAFLDQINAVNKIVFTGGEPTLNIGGMLYFMQGVLDRNIKIQELEITTNGIFLSDVFVRFIIVAFNHIKIYKPDDSEKPVISIIISKDMYHFNDADKALNYYRHAFAEYPDIRVVESSLGNITIKEGRATKIDYAFAIDAQPLRKIEYMTKDHVPACPHLENLKLDYEEQIFIPCMLYLSAKGDLLTLNEIRHEYTWIDIDNRNKVCNVLDTDDYLQEIIKFNHNKMHCMAFMLGRFAVKREKQDNQTIDDTNYTLFRRKLLLDYAAEKERLGIADIIVDTRDLLDKWLEYKSKYNCNEFGNVTT